MIFDLVFGEVLMCEDVCFVVVGCEIDDVFEEWFDDVVFLCCCDCVFCLFV